MFQKLINLIRQVWNKMIGYRDIEAAISHVESPISTEMVSALDDWYNMYTEKADWLKPDTVKSLNLPAFISSEIARQIILELKWNITAKDKEGNNQSEDGMDITNPRSEYLKNEFEKCFHVLRQKLEQGCAAGGMVMKPYPKDGHIYFDWTMDWSLYPMAFDDDGNLKDVIFRDVYTEGKNIYTRLERHKIKGDNVTITQKVFKSQFKDSLGSEVELSEVDQWKDLQPEATVENTEGPLFGWFRVATANNIDVDSPFGASVFAKAKGDIKEADLQYSRLLWEFEGSELAIDVDPMVLRPKSVRDIDGKTRQEMPKLNERLFRGVDTGSEDMYNVFAPSIRDASLLAGLNHILMRVEDNCGLARGCISEMNLEARTATELKVMKQRSYATVSDNQDALERCFRDVIRAMDKYATLYNLAPEGEYDVSFEWDDSIITDMDQQVDKRLILLNNGIISKSEFREWYFGETQTQAQAAIEAISAEQLAGMEQLLPKVQTE